MTDTTGAKPIRVTMHCQFTVLLRVELMGAVEVASQVIIGASGDGVLYKEPTIQDQCGVEQCLAQAPDHHSGEPPRLARVS